MAKIKCNVVSYKLKRTVDFTVIIPTITIPESLSNQNLGYNLKENFPVLYLLHGFGNNHEQWCSYTNIERYAEERNIAVVMIAGENKAYLNNGDDLFYDFIEQELPDLITHLFPISNRVEDTYIAGLSMGGFGSLYHGLTNSSRYEAIGAFSSGFGICKDIDMNDVVTKLCQSSSRIPNIYLTCGDNDFVYESNVYFREHLVRLGVNHTWKSVSGAGHDWRFWDQSIEQFLDWIKRKDAYANQMRKI